MLREHAPLIAVSAVVSILFYLVFRDLRTLRSGVEGLASAQLMPAGAATADLALDSPADTPTPTAHPAEGGEAVAAVSKAPNKRA